MSATRLLVPMHLEAMVLNEEASEATPFLRFHMDYQRLASFQSPEPPPFGGGSTTQPAAGIYLHWTLPAALRHGIQQPDGTIEFPLVPNRWLVARIQAGVAPALAVKAWVVESDFWDADDPHAGTSPFVEPTGTGTGSPMPTSIGRAQRLGTASPAPGPSQPFLRVIGPGSMTFAAFAPGVENVFAFHDDVTGDDDITPIGEATFTYHVAGWYSSPELDPLRATAWVPEPGQAGGWSNDPFGWIAYTGDDTPPSLCQLHALVSGVPWDRDGENPLPDTYPTDVQGTVKVAVGSTAIDGLAAIVRLDRQSATEADLLEAFQYGLLDTFDEPGSAEVLNMEIRQHWFGAFPGGTLWTVVAAERSGNTGIPAPPPAEITPAQQAALDTLNARQSEWDRQGRILESMQANLYSLWWKAQWQAFNDPPVDGDLVTWLSTQLPLHVGIGSDCSADPGWYVCQVREQQALTDTLAAEVTAARRDLEAQLTPDAHVLRATNLPQYHGPNDPVVVATGLGRSTALDPGDALVCRVVSQTVNALTVSGIPYRTDGGEHDVSQRLPVLADPNGVLPAEVQPLHVESVFLSPTLAAQDLLGAAAPPSAVEAAIAALPPPGVASEFCPWSGAMSAWAQPWAPLLLDWEVTVLKSPAYTAATGDATCTFNSENWAFDGTDFRWSGATTSTGTDFDEADSQQMTLSGRTFITPQLSSTLAGQLQEWVEQHKLRDPSLEALLEDLDEYVAAIKGQDVLSQRLSGLMGMLLQRDPTAGVAPTGAVTEALGDEGRSRPRPYPNPHSSDVPAVWDFAPMAGTFFVINRLSVIDTQGRTLDLLQANYSSDPRTGGSIAENYFFPIAGRGVRAPTSIDPYPTIRESSDPTQRMLQLAPRLVQGAQLRVDLLSADGATSSPVGGWIVPNHLDRSLALYAADGTAWGELYLAREGAGYVPSWYPDPTNPDAPATVADIPNPYVRKIVTALVARTDSGAGFWDFFRAVDEALWTIDPKATEDVDLSVLVGRPLAVVRAELALRLRGLPVVNQDWWNTFDLPAGPLPDPTRPAPLAAVDGGVGELLWPVQLGSQAMRHDGVIGYYLDDPTDAAATFQVFNSLVVPGGAASGYLRQIGADGNFVRLRATDDRVTAPDPARNEVATLTLLVDPAASIHSFSGLLPVTVTTIPAPAFVPALRSLSYLFRAGPFLTPTDQVRMPRPAETKGSWVWFDEVLNRTSSLTAADGGVTLPSVPPLVKEGWLKFTPNPPLSEDE